MKGSIQPHGSNSRYLYQRCRCELCRAAHADANRKCRAREYELRKQRRREGKKEVSRERRAYVDKLVELASKVAA